jgi:3-deoxy-D-manno-octulosonate 8-phosphate phosphatase (KDO 8-P phosphatase)
VFHAADGHGIKMLAASGVVTALLSGRRAPAVERRAAELGITQVLQGIEDKRPAFEQLLAQLGIDAGAAGFMGDELVDLPVMTRCGFACAPMEAPEFVRRHAQYVTRTPAGGGAVRELCELLMQAQGTLEAQLAAYVA